MPRSSARMKTTLGARRSCFGRRRALRDGEQQRDDGQHMAHKRVWLVLDMVNP